MILIYYFGTDEYEYEFKPTYERLCDIHKKKLSTADLITLFALSVEDPDDWDPRDIFDLILEKNSTALEEEFYEPCRSEAYAEYEDSKIDPYTRYGVSPWDFF